MIHHLLANTITFPLAQGMGSDGSMGWGMAMMVAVILVVVLVIFGVIWLVRDQPRERRATSSGDPAPEGAFQALERRFAEGEIDVDEYRKRRSELLAAR